MPHSLRRGNVPDRFHDEIRNHRLAPHGDEIELEISTGSIGRESSGDGCAVLPPSRLEDVEVLQLLLPVRDNVEDAVSNGRDAVRFEKAERDFIPAVLERNRIAELAMAGILVKVHI